jgi:hypothetical protein
MSMRFGSRTVEWAIALTLLGGFLLAFFMDLTGLAWHQWLGLGVGVLAAYHGWIHRAWVASVARRILAPGTGQGRLYLLVDSFLLLGFFSILGTGLLISIWFDLSLAGNAFWRNLHILTALMTLGLVVFKVGTHWRWIVTATKTHVAALADCLEADDVPVAGVRQNVPPGRREFLGLMGLVGLAAVLASASSLQAVLGQAGDGSSVDTSRVDVAQADETAQSNAAAPASEAAQSNAAPGNLSSCTVQCGHRCSFPGDCGRYTDADGDRLCDWGECA